MACINADGTITETARTLLQAALKASLSPEDISVQVGQPLFRVRSSLRELTGAGFIREENGKYTTTDIGKGKL
jgi:predicted transcriptional regulator